MSQRGQLMTQSEAAILAARRDRVKPESSHLNVKEEEGAGEMLSGSGHLLQRTVT